MCWVRSLFNSAGRNKAKAALLAGLERMKLLTDIYCQSSRQCGAVTSRCFTTAPLTVHSAHPVQVALSLTAACYIPEQ